MRRKTRIRTFQTAWKQQFTWLSYDESSSKMFCDTCKEYEKTGTFVTGRSNFKKEVVRAHSESDGHKKYSLRQSAEANPGTSTAALSFFIYCAYNYQYYGMKNKLQYRYFVFYCRFAVLFMLMT